MFACEQGSSANAVITQNEAGKLRDELGYLRSLHDPCGCSLLSLRVKAYLEFGIDLRSQEEPVAVHTAFLNSQVCTAS